MQPSKHDDLPHPVYRPTLLLLQVMKFSCPGAADPQPAVCPGFTFPVPSTVTFPVSTKAAAATVRVSAEEQLVALQEAGQAVQGGLSADLAAAAAASGSGAEPSARTMLQRLMASMGLGS